MGGRYALGPVIVILLLHAGAIAMAQEQNRGMRVELERSGGVAGPIRRPPVKLDAEALPPQDRDDLDRLIAAADFFRQPERFPGPGYADAMETRLTIEDPGRRHAVTFHDGDGHPEQLDRLTDWILAHRPRK